MIKIKKSAPTKISAQKRKFQSSPNKLNIETGVSHNAYTEFAFYQIQYKHYDKKGYKYPIKENTPLFHTIFSLFGEIIITRKTYFVNKTVDFFVFLLYNYRVIKL